MHCLSLNLVRRRALEMKTVAETNDLLHIIVKLKTLVVLQLFCRRPLIHELFLKVVIAKGIQ